MRRMSVHVSTRSSWSHWTAEMESAVVQLVKDVAKDFGHRARFVTPPDLGYWRVSAFVSARSLREGEEIRREVVRLAKQRRVNLFVRF